MSTTVNHLSILANNTGQNIGNSVGDFFNTLSDTFNAAGDYVVFGSNDRRHGQMGLIIGPIYDLLWQNLTVVISTMFGMTIEDYCNFNDRMYGYMTRLMLVNLWEHNTTLSMLCEGSSNQANGNSQTITHEAQIPPFTKGNNYLENVRKIITDQQTGVHSTTVEIDGNPYKKVKNLFPDDNDQRKDGFNNSDVWEVSDPNSILYKTKCLFKQHKINSIISRFGTHADPTEGTTIPIEGNASTKYGLSHGRNLLTKEGEEGYAYDVNGYNNPYCRVWTHHHQYKKYEDTIRPFKNNYDGVTKSHDWGDRFKGGYELKDNGDTTPPSLVEQNAWKSNARWDKTVFEKRSDGLINITPKFMGGGEKNIHAKDCMFSIENLAWKDYDPYSFETALSWEQRGPLGGRIMWFPPYGLTFNETSQAQWNASTFIGRGEDVYTYVNTKRTGTLQFLMLVDHPSVIDYVTWYEGNRDKVSETDILRYFAGCDQNDKEDENSLLYYVQPTPLTDEGVQKEKVKDDNPERVKPKDPPPVYVEDVQFMVYFPNNYSGMFDTAKDQPGVDSDFVIKYLLSGKNAQDKYTLNGDGKRITSRETLISEFNGRGYEMETDLGITDETEGDEYAMIGNKNAFVKSQTEKEYEPTSSKIWKYRVDGKYKVPITETDPLNNIYSNTLGQTLNGEDSYKDTQSFHLNCSLENQGRTYGGTVPKTAYTFTEIVKAIAELYEKNDILEILKKKTGLKIDDDRVKHLKEVFSGVSEKGKLNLIGLTFHGFANSQGVNKSESVNEKRNQNLAKERANSIKTWLQSVNPKWGKAEVNNNDSTPINQGSGDTSTVEKVTTKNENDMEAKLFRCMNCVMTFKADTTVDATDADPMANEKYVNYCKIENEKFGDHDVYRLVNDDGSKWVETEDGVLIKIDPDGDFKDSADEEYWYRVMTGAKGYDTDFWRKRKLDKDTLFNKVRYDQEYHFFRRMSEEKPMVFKKLMDKLQYFDPAFHSMSPEGFNARLTFLNQCTRQGDTVGVSDKNRISASNMAFGRPPFCVLRIGDFYNQMIVIDSINIQYDTQGGITWDLNDEGAGVQPMLAQVSLNFTFIGGGSLDGPIRRLQNAMSFNYYANAELYDNRADRGVYTYDRELPMGGANKHEFDVKNSKFHSVEMYDPNK